MPRFTSWKSNALWHFPNSLDFACRASYDEQEFPSSVATFWAATSRKYQEPESGHHVYMHVMYTDIVSYWPATWSSFLENVSSVMMLVASRVLFQDFHKNIWNICKWSSNVHDTLLLTCVQIKQKGSQCCFTSSQFCVCFQLWVCMWMVVFACMKVHMGAYTCWCRCRPVVDIWNPPQFHFWVFYIKTGSLHETPNYGYIVAFAWVSGYLNSHPHTCKLST